MILHHIISPQLYNKSYWTLTAKRSLNPAVNTDTWSITAESQDDHTLKTFLQALITKHFIEDKKLRTASAMKSKADGHETVVTPRVKHPSRNVQTLLFGVFVVVVA